MSGSEDTNFGMSKAEIDEICARYGIKWEDVRKLLLQLWGASSRFYNDVADITVYSMVARLDSAHANEPEEQ